MQEQLRPNEGVPETPPIEVKREEAEDYREKSGKIAACGSFEELYGALREIGTIKGKDAEAVIDTVKTIEGGAGAALNYVTREYGLRPKVHELFKEKHLESKV